MFSGHWQITINVIAITLTVMAIFVGGGYYLDQVFATKPALLIAGTVVAFPIAQFIIYRRFRSLTNRISNK